MPRFVLIISLWFFPTLATAAPFPVQSGEHDGFTRIVAQVPKGGAWEVKHSGQKVTLTVEGHSDGFNTVDVFARIARDRISATQSRPSSLVLTLECACRVSAFASGQDYAVIDVAAPGTKLITPLLEPTASPMPISRADPQTETDRKANHSPAPLELPTIVKTPSARKAPAELGLDRVALNEAQRAALSEIQSQLAVELGAATTRGLLAPSINAQPSARPQIDTAEFAAALPSAPSTDQRPTTLSNIRISNSLDMPFKAQKRGAGTTRKGLSCPSNAEIAIETWGNPESFDQQVSAGRAALYGEFDRIDPEAVLKLTRSYLYFGFGAEARRVLSLAPELARKNQLLLDISDILDHGRPRRSKALQAFADCSSDIALWAILAQDEQSGSTALPVDTALRTLNRLPAHLRRFVAPHLSRQLLMRGYDAAAAAALRSLERLPEKLPVEATLAQAHVALKVGKIDVGTAKLETMVEEGSTHSPKALIALVNARFDRGEPVSVETTELVAAYAQEHRDTPLGTELRHAHIMALLKSQQFDFAFQIINAFHSLENPEKASALRLSLLRELIANADDIVFLDLIMKHREGEIALLHGPVKFDLAARFLSLGFAAEAQSFLALEPETAWPVRHKLLAAEAALALEQPFQAQAALLGLEDPAAAPLRAQAKAMTGAFDEADDLFRQANLPGLAGNAAWLAEDWRDRTPISVPVFGPTARLAESRPQTSNDPNGMLARTVAALEESAAARDTLGDLLSATALNQTLTE